MYRTVCFYMPHPVFLSIRSLSAPGIMTRTCGIIVNSNCTELSPRFQTYADRYDDASAVWVMVCAILMFFMKAGFLFIELAFAKTDVPRRRRVVLAKYLDTFGSSLGFFLFGFAISTSKSHPFFLGEHADYVFWFFRFTFASNTATILGGLLVGGEVQLRAISIFIYAFVMSGLIHPMIARMAWVVGVDSPISFSPFRYCNGTPRATVLTAHTDDSFLSGDLHFPSLLYIDFAGSGTVHLLGGMAGFVLAIFHLFEMKHKGPFHYFDPNKMKCLRKKKQVGETVAEGDQNTLKKRNENDEDRDEGTVFQKTACPKRIIDIRNFLDWMYPAGGGEGNVENAALGVMILWTTWFAFNAGSTESISGTTFHAVVGRIALVMGVAGATGGLTSAIVCGLVQIYKRDTEFNTNEIANGVLACLVAVTGCCPFIDPLWAILIGPLTILFYHVGCYIVYLLDIQDGARIFPLHGICGFWGVLCVGFFYEKCLVLEVYGASCFCDDYLESQLAELLSNKGLIIGYQLAGGIIIILLAILFCGTLFLLLWFFPVKLLYYATGLYWLFNFKDEPGCCDKNPEKYKKRGKINFKGSLLFTHFNEIEVATPDDINTEERHGTMRDRPTEESGL